MGFFDDTDYKKGLHRFPQFSINSRLPAVGRVVRFYLCNRFLINVIREFWIFSEISSEELNLSAGLFHHLTDYAGMKLSFLFEGQHQSLCLIRR